MREIKFRVWDSKYKVWTAAFSIRNSLVSEFNKEYNEKYLTIQQFTGLLDKNGKEIYEGDIIHTKNNTYREIGFSEGAFWAALINVETPEPELLFKILHSYECKVVGNIFENGDLLK